MRIKLKSVVKVPNLESQVISSAHELSGTSKTRMPSLDARKESPAYVLHKCLVTSQTELETANDEKKKKDCQFRLDYIKRIQEELRKRQPTRAVFLDGQQKPASHSHSYTKWVRYDAFGEAETQWPHYFGNDG